MPAPIETLEGPALDSGPFGDRVERLDKHPIRHLVPPPTTSNKSSPLQNCEPS
jgi:hypothetical protein